MREFKDIIDSELDKLECDDSDDDSINELIKNNNIKQEEEQVDLIYDKIKEKYPDIDINSNINDDELKLIIDDVFK